jgi:hypothetical protein
VATKFDDLSKALASGVSRRQALRLIAGGVGGTVLAAVGVGRAKAAVNPCSAFCATFHGAAHSECMQACKACGGDVTRLCATAIPGAERHLLSWPRPGLLLWRAEWECDLLPERQQLLYWVPGEHGHLLPIGHAAVLQPAERYDRVLRQQPGVLRRCVRQCRLLRQGNLLLLCRVLLLWRGLLWPRRVLSLGSGLLLRPNRSVLLHAWVSRLLPVEERCRLVRRVVAPNSP